MLGLIFCLPGLLSRSVMTREQRHWRQPPHSNALTLLGALIHVYQFPTHNTLITIRSRSKDRLCGQKLCLAVGDAHQLDSPPPMRTRFIILAHLVSRLDADGRVGTTFARWPRSPYSPYHSDTVNTGGLTLPRCDIQHTVTSGVERNDQVRSQSVIEYIPV